MGAPISSRSVNETKLEALVETMYLAARADGELTAEERTHFVSSVQSLTDSRLEGDTLRVLLERFESVYQKSGRQECLQSVKARLGEARSCHLALSMAIGMLASDGVLRTAEREFILELADTLGIDRGSTDDLVKEIAG